MAVRAKTAFTNFTAGEWSPRLFGRTDLAKYANACALLENCIIHPQGGASGRYGTHFVAEVKTSATAVRLLSFRFSADQAYILELGAGYMRFYSDNGRIEVGGVPVEIATPYGAEELFEIHAAQSADTLFLAHPSHPPYQLVRYSHTLWRLDAVSFTPSPCYEYGHRPAAALTPAAVSGANVQFDTAGGEFLASDLYREIVAGPGRAVITTVDGAQMVHATITSVFPSTAPILASGWRISGSPLTTLLVHFDGLVGVSPKPGHAVRLASTIDAFRSGDVGKFVRVFGGTVQIYQFDDSRSVWAKVLTALDATVKEIGQPLPLVPQDSWTLEEGAWSAAHGYPATVSWFEGRLLWAATATQPRTWWASSAGDPYDYALGSADDDAMAWTVDSKEVNTIRWLAPSTRLLIGTAGAEHTATGGNEGAITPSNVPLVRVASRHGSGTLPPLETGDAVLFLTASGKKLREMGYRYETDNFRSPDLLKLAEHLTGAQLSHWITDLAYQAEPDGIVWACRSDGVLLGLTYLREEDVIGWHRHTTDGAFESVACIPSPDMTHDQAWFVVRRTIGGVTKRYVEYMDQTHDQYGGVALGAQVDSCLTYSGAPATTFSGLGHMEGKTVHIVGGGAVYPPAVVADGSVTISGPAVSPAAIGLPYTRRLRTMRPEVPVGGTSQGARKAWGPVTVRLLETLGVTINGEQVPFRTAADEMDVPPPLYTGDKTVSMLGWDTDAWLTIEQTQPLPFTVLAAFGPLAIGD